MSISIVHRLGILAKPTRYATILNSRPRAFGTRRGKVLDEPTTWQNVLRRFVPVGLCLIAVMQWRYYRKISGERTAHHWEIRCYCALPLRVVSRCWGWIADKHLPESIRPFVYKLYVTTFGVNLTEAADEDLKSYPSLADFFARQLKKGVRKIDQTGCLVSPCDGTVLHVGPVSMGQVEQVKGVTYTLEKFLGENTWTKQHNPESDYHVSLLHKPEKGHQLYHCIIYLAPGDYHRFHSPTEWKPTHRRHFHGELLSVNPSIAKWLPGLFCLNERAVYLGTWEHGFFSMAAVGATNVGTVRVYCDATLHTNHPRHKQMNQWKDKFLGSNIEMIRGDEFGEFRMGSSIVLVFEAPSHYQFTVSPGQRVLMGQRLGRFTKTKFVDTVEKLHTNVFNRAF